MDVFLHCTLGGFAPVPRDRAGTACYPDKLERELWRLAALPGRLPWGTVMVLAERWGRSKNSLAATLVYHRRALYRARVRDLYKEWRRTTASTPR